MLSLSFSLSAGQGEKGKTLHAGIAGPRHEPGWELGRLVKKAVIDGKEGDGRTAKETS